MSGARCVRPSGSSDRASSGISAQLGFHLIGRQEIFTSMGDDLIVAGMIDGLDPDQLLAPGRIVMLDMLDQLIFGKARPANQHLGRIGKRRGHVVVIVLVLLGVTVGVAAAVMMQMDMGL